MSEVEKLKKELNDSNIINKYLKNENKKLLIEVNELKEANKKLNEKLNEINLIVQNLKLDNEKLKSELQSLKISGIQENLDTKFNI